MEVDEERVTKSSENLSNHHCIGQMGGQKLARKLRKGGGITLKGRIESFEILLRPDPVPFLLEKQVLECLSGSVTVACDSVSGL